MNNLTGRGRVTVRAEAALKRRGVTEEREYVTGQIRFDGPWVHVESTENAGEMRSFPAHSVLEVRWSPN
ncbi:hypothetical protein [Streptacidiphilus sp. MAP5-3]|uniref:hypothetical protein n=1 Tax=unclassified Streptacidiphilus TaxID=2643834 RepID=UPI003517CDC8